MSASYNKLAGVLTAAGLKAKRLLTPWGARRLGHTVTATVTTTVWVVDCIHNNTADRWADAKVT